MSVDTVEKLLVNELKDIYSAEKQITRALPKMAKNAASDELRTAFETHLKETEGQIKRLDRVFEILGKSSGGKTCKAMHGLLEEGSETMEETEGEVRDAAMICAAQKVEHYEMAGYGSVRTWAQQLGQRRLPISCSRRWTKRARPTTNSPSLPAKSTSRRSATLHKNNGQWAVIGLGLISVLALITVHWPLSFTLET